MKGGGGAGGLKYFQFIFQHAPFVENFVIYKGLENHVQNMSEGRKLNINAENDCKKLHCSLRDLSSLLQTIGRLAEHFIGPSFRLRFEDARTLVKT